MAKVDVNNVIDAIKSVKQQDIAKYIKNFNDNKAFKGSGIMSMWRNGFSFEQFKSIKDSYDKIDKLRNNPDSNPTDNAIIEDRLEVLDDYNIGTYQDFLDDIETDDPDFIDTKNVTDSLLENIKSFINIGGLYKRDRIIASQDKRGFFDFSLASQGLYRPIEFYSQELENDIKNKILENPFALEELPDGVVNPNKVEKFVGKFIYDNKYTCERRQRGTTDVFNTFPDECRIGTLSTGISVTLKKNVTKDSVFNGRGKNKLKYASTNKKSYLIFERKKENAKYVDIFCAYNFIGSTNGVRVLAILPALLVAGALEEYNIKVRISVQRLGSDDGVHSTISIPLKDYEEPLKESYNRIMNVIGKKKTGEQYFAFFKVILQNSTTTAPRFKSSRYYFEKVRYYFDGYYTQMMSRYKNWVEENKDKEFVNTKVTNPNFQIGIPTLATGQDGFENTTNIGKKLTYLDIIANLPFVFFRFYYYMDFLAVEMLTMQEFTKQIVNRFVDDINFKTFFKVPVDKVELRKIIREYIVGILTEKYVVNDDGAYADTPEQKRIKNETLEAKIKFLDESLDNLLV
tara:strand:- start:2845 stop:4557 length:1713 start_codon:yes stop_codon:yes gene_type:complete